MKRLTLTVDLCRLTLRHVVWSALSVGIVTSSQAAPPPVPAVRPPQITSTSMHGLQSGALTAIAVRGTDLLPDPKLIGIPAARQAIRPGATPQLVEFEVTLAAGIPIGHYALRVQTPAGISQAVPIAVDSLPQILDGTASGLSLPAAVSGELSGARRTQIFVSGRAGERIVVDVECRRLGGTLSPVLELKNSRRTPVAIQWSQAALQGDARIVSRFPEDGVYIVELHDLAFQASANNPFRLKIGDLKLADAVFPPVLPAGTRREVKLLGPGWENAPPVTADTLDLLPGMVRSVVVPAAAGAAAPAPQIAAGEAIEVLERSASKGPQAIATQQLGESQLTVAVNGLLSQSGETDSYLLQVEPGTTLRLRMDSRLLHSRLDPQLVISRPQGDILVQSEERAELDWQIPAGMKTVIVTVRDLHGNGGSDFPYRMEILPLNRPAFSLSLRDDRISLPVDGRGIVRLDVERHGYAGPISLRPQGASHFDLLPTEIPAGADSVWLQASPRRSAASHDIQNLRLTGESTGISPSLRTTARIQTGQRLSLVADAQFDLPVSLQAPAGIDLEPQSLPQHFFRGIPVEIPVGLTLRKLPAGAEAVKLTLVTTEVPRQRTINPARGSFALVRSTDEAAVPLQTKTGKSETPISRAVLHVKVPNEGPDNEMDCAIRADLLQNSMSVQPLATTYSKTFRRKIPSAATIKYDSNAVVLASGAPAKFTGKVIRHRDYHETVEVSLKGLPKEYLAPKVTVPPDQENFELIITSPRVTAGGEILNINFVVKDLKGNILQPELLLPARVEVKK